MCEGDIVRIRSDLIGEDHYNGVYVNQNMIQYRSREARIIRVSTTRLPENSSDVIVYSLDIDQDDRFRLGSGWMWSEDMLELITADDVECNNSEEDLIALMMGCVMA